ncbi:MAG: hypothetical protein WCF33_13195 [Pseudonocardiaceae bacterium]
MAPKTPEAPKVSSKSAAIGLSIGIRLGGATCRTAAAGDGDEGVEQPGPESGKDAAAQSPPESLRRVTEPSRRLRSAPDELSGSQSFQVTVYVLPEVKSAGHLRWCRSANVGAARPAEFIRRADEPYAAPLAKTDHGGPTRGIVNLLGLSGVMSMV